MRISAPTCDPNPGGTASVQQVPIGVTLTLGTSSYCVTFGGKIKADGTDGLNFKASNAAALEPCN